MLRRGHGWRVAGCSSDQLFRVKSDTQSVDGEKHEVQTGLLEEMLITFPKSRYGLDATAVDNVVPHVVNMDEAFTVE